MSRRLLTALPVLCLGVWTSSVEAHHSHPYFYDACKRVTIEGRIERVEFKNPHSLIFLRLDDGVAYTVDWAGLRGLTTRGVIGPAKDAFVSGARIEVTGNRMRTAAEIRARFPDFKGDANPNVLDPIAMRRVDDAFSWRLPGEANAPACASASVRR